MWGKKINIRLKILMASVLINAANINASYCMEEKEKNESQTEIKDETELQKQLGMKCSFEKILYSYKEYSSDTMKCQEIIEKFSKYLFGNKGENLDTVLSSNDINELECIYEILQYNSVQKYLVEFLLQNYNSLSENISNIIKDNNKNGLQKVINNEIKPLMERCNS